MVLSMKAGSGGAWADSKVLSWGGGRKIDVTNCWYQRNTIPKIVICHPIS